MDHPWYHILRYLRLVFSDLGNLVQGYTRKNNSDPAEPLILLPGLCGCLVDTLLLVRVYDHLK
jgi:hypothetical protein